jgi:hypothetical protein
MTKKSTRKKVSQKSYLPTLLIVFVSVLIVLGLLNARNKRVEMQRIQIQKQMAAQKLIEYPLDTENDGVYTDYKYGFTFKYPKDVFKYQMERYAKDNSDYAEISWDKLEDGSSYIGGIKEGAYIRFRVNSDPISKEDKQRDFEHIYSSPVGVVNSKTPTMEYETKKIRNLSIKGVQGMIYDDLVDYSYGNIHYFAAWKKDDNTFWLTVSTNNKDESAKYKKMFEDIVSSFKFIN